MRVAVTGARGALGTALFPLLAAHEVRAVDRVDGIELEDRDALRRALRGCDAVAHLAALHPLVAPAGADERTYDRANVAPLRVLIEVAREAGVRRVVFASSTSVWRDEPAAGGARFLDEEVPADADDPYGRSKREGERLLAASGLGAVVLRLARFAREGEDADEVRKLYRAVDPRDAALAFALAIEAAREGLFVVSAPTPFRDEDRALLARDPGAAIRLRTGRSPAWVPARIASVARATRLASALGWRARHPSAYLAPA